jgi:hypothetical protein
MSDDDIPPENLICLEHRTIGGHATCALPPEVRVQFAKLGTIPAALQARLTKLGVELG